MKFTLSDHPHRRLNILTGEWILVSPHRAKRPWQGQVEKISVDVLPSYDPACYLCPGNKRAGGARNPRFESTHVFTNDFSALLDETPGEVVSDRQLIVAKGESGTCRVVCFSPRHDLTLPEMEAKQIRNIVDVWTSEYESLAADPSINYVQIFENKGPVMGCSNPHPHGQIWAQRTIPTEPSKELKHFARYRSEKSSCLLCDYLSLEISRNERIVCRNDDFVVLIPFWATWPFETIIISAKHCGALTDFSGNEKDAFADIIKRLTTRYDNLFEISFPYSAGIHQSPTDNNDHPEWHFHMHFYPPLLRSATVKKFMVGYEMLADPQRDTTAELCAERLRNVPEAHYKLLP